MFTKNEFKLLNKNLNFIPNPGKPNQKNFKNDADNFYRRIILRAHFGNEEPPPNEGFIGSNKSNWTPKNIHHSVKTFIESVNNDLISAETGDQPIHKQNLSKGEIEALNDLKGRDDIIISKADKGGAVVIQNVDDPVQGG